MEADRQAGESGATAAEHQPEPAFTGEGPLLVYVPGLDGTGRLFFKQTPELARAYRVATFRLRDGGGFTYDDLAEDVAAVIRRAGESRAIIVAESFGGTVALHFALRYPGMVERLVIVNSFSRYRWRWRIKAASRLAAVLPFRLVWMFRRTVDSLGLLAEGVRREDRRRFFEAIRTVERNAYARRLRLIEQVNLDDRLPEIDAPTLFIAAVRDPVVPSVREARFMASRVPNAQVRIIPLAGHACLMSDHVRLAEILAEA